MATRRRSIPPDLAADVLYRSRHTCCICRQAGKDVQIHHIDGDRDNNVLENLAVLSLDCHSLVTGPRGLGRAYSPKEVRKHRDSWEQKVAAWREQTGPDGRRASPDDGSPVAVHAPPVNVLPPTWNVPHRRNPNFTGREELLEELHTQLASGEHAALTQAISGLGGVGKTQLALEYAYRHAADYDLVWWVAAEDTATLATTFAALATELNLPVADEADLRLVRDAVRRELEQRAGWLLVFDNAQEPGHLREYLPRAPTGHVVLTSRNPNWGTLARPLAVQVWPRSESVEFLRKRTGDPDEQSADALAEALGDLPLALEHAAAYVEQTGCSLSHYLVLFRERREEVLARARPPEGYDATVATTWEVSLGKIRETSPAAVDILNLCAFLAPHDIPREVIALAVKNLMHMFREALADPVQFDDAVSAARRYSLLDVRPGSVSMHRLVQAVIRDQLTADARREWCTAALRTIQHTFPSRADDPGEWSRGALLLPHALATVQNAEQHGALPQLAASVLNAVGSYLNARGFFEQAKRLLERAVATAEQALGREHEDTGIYMSNLALVLRALGDLPASLRLCKGSLRIAEAALGNSDLSVATCLNNLGGVLEDMGDMEAARQHYARALAIMEESAGPDDPGLAPCLNNLGIVLQSLGDAEGGRTCLERSLVITEKAFGPDHPKTATLLANLGLALERCGEADAAREVLERAVAIAEGGLGPDHPNLAPVLSNLATVLRHTGDLPEARSLLKRAVAITERVLGPDHRKLAARLNRLGAVLHDLGEGCEATSCFRRAATIAKRAITPDPDTVAFALSNLADVRLESGNLTGAKEAAEGALSAIEETYGVEHDNVAKYALALGDILHRLGDHDSALCQYGRALEIIERSYGVSSTHVARVASKMGFVHRKRGDLDKARAFFEKACAVERECHGSNSPEAARSLSNLALVTEAQGDLVASRRKLELALGIARDSLGDDHPHTVAIRENLDAILRTMDQRGGECEARPR